MGIMRFVSALLAAVCAAGGIYAAMAFRGAPPVLLDPPRQAREQAEGLMDALCQGDFELAETMLYGSWELGLDREPADPVGKILWNAYLDSLDYRLCGELYAAETGLFQDAELLTLDLSSVTANLSRRCQQLLQQAVAEAEDVSQLYDEKNNYREELVMQILETAAGQALREDGNYITHTLSLHLCYSDGRWLVAADPALLDAIGGMEGRR